MESVRVCNTHDVPLGDREKANSNGQVLLWKDAAHECERSHVRVPHVREEVELSTLHLSL